MLSTSRLQVHRRHPPSRHIVRVGDTILQSTCRSGVQNLIIVVQGIQSENKMISRRSVSAKKRRYLASPRCRFRPWPHGQSHLSSSPVRGQERPDFELTRIAMRNLIHGSYDRRVRRTKRVSRGHHGGWTKRSQSFSASPLPAGYCRKLGWALQVPFPEAEIVALS